MGHTDKNEKRMVIRFYSNVEKFKINVFALNTFVQKYKYIVLLFNAKMPQQWWSYPAWCQQPKKKSKGVISFKCSSDLCSSIHIALFCCRPWRGGRRGDIRVICKETDAWCFIYWRVKNWLRDYRKIAKCGLN